MSRSAKFNLLTLVAFALTLLLLACVAHAQGIPDPTGIATSPGGAVDSLIADLSLGLYVAGTLAGLEGVELALLAWSKRSGSPLASWAPWLSAGAAITGTALGTLAVQGQGAEWRAVPTALLTAAIAYYASPARRAENVKFPKGDTLQVRKEDGFVDRNVMLGLAGVWIVVLGILALFAFALGCGPIRKAGDAARDNAIDCAKAGGLAHLKDVTVLLEDGGATWEHDLGELALHIGEDTVACDVRAVVAVLEQTSSTAVPSTAATISTAETRALINGRVLIARKGWQFASEAAP